MSALAVRQSRADSLHEGEYALSRRSFEIIAGMLRNQSGIALSEAKATLVYSRLAKRLRTLGLRDFDEYCALLQSDAGRDERVEMLAALTTNVTRFYREPHHFDHLRERIMPALAEAARAGARVRLWSSACSTGEEPYSIALTVLEVLPEAAQLDVRILATDIDPKVIATAQAGKYRTEALTPVPPRVRERAFRKDTDGWWSVHAEVRALIVFRQLNLIGQWPMRGRFDVIFCRNVVIYFEEETQALIWNRFRDALTPQGRLYIGHSERVDSPAFASDGLTIYRLASLGRGS